MIVCQALPSFLSFFIMKIKVPQISYAIFRSPTCIFHESPGQRLCRQQACLHGCIDIGRARQYEHGGCRLADRKVRILSADGVSAQHGTIWLSYIYNVCASRHILLLHKSSLKARSHGLLADQWFLALETTTGMRK